MAFYKPEICNLFDKRIFIEISYDTFIERKERDLRWGNIPKHYFDHIWESYLKYGKIPRTEAEYLTIDGERSIDIDHVLNYIYR